MKFLKKFLLLKTNDDSSCDGKGKSSKSCTKNMDQLGFVLLKGLAFNKRGEARYESRKGTDMDVCIRSQYKQQKSKLFSLW